MPATNAALAVTKSDDEFGLRVRQQEKRLLTKAELTSKLNLSNPRYVEALVQKRRIPYVRLGYRTIRFD